MLTSFSDEQSIQIGFVNTQFQLKMPPKGGTVTASNAWLMRQALIVEPLAFWRDAPQQRDHALLAV